MTADPHGEVLGRPLRAWQREALAAYDQADGPDFLVTIGVILLIVGLILNFVPIGGTRRRYY